MKWDLLNVVFILYVMNELFQYNKFTSDMQAIVIFILFVVLMLIIRKKKDNGI